MHLDLASLLAVGLALGTATHARAQGTAQPGRAPTPPAQAGAPSAATPPAQAPAPAATPPAAADTPESVPPAGTATAAPTRAAAPARDRYRGYGAAGTISVSGLASIAHARFGPAASATTIGAETTVGLFLIDQLELGLGLGAAWALERVGASDAFSWQFGLVASPTYVFTAPRRPPAYVEAALDDQAEGGTVLAPYVSAHLGGFMLDSAGPPTDFGASVGASGGLRLSGIMGLGMDVRVTYAHRFGLDGLSRAAAEDTIVLGMGLFGYRPVWLD